LLDVITIRLDADVSVVVDGFSSLVHTDSKHRIKVQVGSLVNTVNRSSL
jgi:hypothetical protein